MAAQPLTLHPASITRALKKAGHNAESRTYAEGVVKVQPTYSLHNSAPVQERRARDIANELLVMGYDVARTGQTVTVTLPEVADEFVPAALEAAVSGRLSDAEAYEAAVAPLLDTDGRFCEGCEGSSGFAPETSKGFCAACVEAARANGHAEQVGTAEEVARILTVTVAEGMGEEIGLPSLGQRESGPNGAISHAARWILAHPESPVLILGEKRCSECGTAVEDFDDEDRNLHRIALGFVLVGCEGFHTALLRAVHKARLREGAEAAAAVVTADTGLSVDDLTSPERAYYALARYAADVANPAVSRMGVEEFYDAMTGGHDPKATNVAEVVEYAASLDEGINLTEDEENLLRRLADDWFSYMDLDRVRAFMRPEGYRWPTPADVHAAISQAKADVLADINDRIVPATVGSFSELHDFTDANMYGGLCDDDAAVSWTNEDGLGPIAASVVQSVVDDWIKAGRPAV